MSPRTTIKTNINKPMTPLAVKAFLNTVEFESNQNNNKALGSGYVSSSDSDVRSATQLLIMPLCPANKGRVETLEGEDKATKKVLEALPNHDSLFGAYRKVINPQAPSCPSMQELQNSINNILISPEYTWARDSAEVFRETATKAIAAAAEVMGVHETEKLVDVETAHAKRNEGYEL